MGQHVEKREEEEEEEGEEKEEHRQLYSIMHFTQTQQIPIPGIKKKGPVFPINNHNLTGFLTTFNLLIVIACDAKSFQ